jgi:hypothetical protein
LGDARPLFAEALRLYRGEPLSATFAADAAQTKAVRDLAAQMSADRSVSADRFADEHSMSAMLWGLLPLAIAGIPFFARKQFFDALFPAGQDPAMGSLILALITFLVWTPACVLTQHALFRSHWIEGHPLLAIVAMEQTARAGAHGFSDTPDGDNGEPMALVERADAAGWASAPNDFVVTTAAAAPRQAARLGEGSGEPAKPIPLGVWRADEMLSPNAAALLAQRAPILTPEQRQAVLGDLASRREEVDLGVVYWGQLPFSYVLLVMASLVAFLPLGAWMLFRVGQKAGRKGLMALADAGAREQFAQHERRVLAEVAGKARVAATQTADDEADPQQRQPRRL